MPINNQMILTVAGKNKIKGTQFVQPNERTKRNLYS